MPPSGTCAETGRLIPELHARADALRLVHGRFSLSLPCNR